MASVAKPSTYRVRVPTTGGSGSQYQSDLAQGIGALADAAGRLSDRRKKEREKEEQQRARDAYLAGKNELADTLNEATADGSLDGMSPEEVLEWGNERLREIRGPIQKHSAEKAEQFDAEGSITLNEFISAARTRQERDALREREAQRLQTDLRFKSDVQDHARTMVRGSEQEADAAFQQIQVLRTEYNEAYANEPVEIRDGYAGIADEWIQKSFFEAALFHAVENGELETFLGRVENGTDYIGTSREDRFTKGLGAGYIRDAVRSARHDASARRTRLNQIPRHDRGRDEAAHRRAPRRDEPERLRRQGRPAGSHPAPARGRRHRGGAQAGGQRGAVPDPPARPGAGPAGQQPGGAHHRHERAGDGRDVREPGGAA